MPFVNGENVGAYRVVEKLGQGGMATVFKAYHPALDRYVAIKVMHPAFAGDPNFLARFQREARIVAKLDHPHIIPIYDYSSHRGHPYLVMRFVEGETLKARMERGSLDMQEVMRISQAVGKALTYAHGQGILHRDIKPSNILLMPDGSVYLTDFGLARMAEAGESTLSRDMMLGTPQYVAPEQAKGVRDLDARTDIYSFGVVLYELLVGRPPFVADTPYAVIHDHIFTPLPLPSELNPDLPEPAQRLLLRALAKEPDDRFQSVEALITALGTALESAPARSAPAAAPSSETIVVSPPTPPPQAKAVERIQVVKEKPEPRKKRRIWPWAVAGIVALLCVVAVGWTVLSQAGDPSKIAERLLEKARIAGEEGDLDRALDLYQQAMETDPQLVPAYLGASHLLIKEGDVDQAIGVLLEGLDANPESHELHKRTAGVALFAERWDVAEGETEWLLREMPDDPLSHTYAAVLMLAQGHPCEEALPELGLALELDPELAWTHYGLALCHLQARNLEEARAELEFVLSQDEISPLLRARAEQKLESLDQGVKRAIERELEDLNPLVSEIPQEDLRMPLEEMLGQANEAWRRGEEEHAIQVLRDAHMWIKEHRDEFGEPLGRELDERLDHIIRLATGTSPP